MRLEEISNLEEEPKKYAAIQNVLGITEVYLGNYNRAYEYFINTISFLNEKSLPEKDELLAVLYNNAGTVTINLPKNATNDKRLMKAVELSKEPYLRFVITLNLTGRVKALASVKEYGVMISRSKEIIKREEQVKIVLILFFFLR